MFTFYLDCRMKNKLIKYCVSFLTVTKAINDNVRVPSHSYIYFCAPISIYVL